MKTDYEEMKNQVDSALRDWRSAARKHQTESHVEVKKLRLRHDRLKRLFDEQYPR